MVKRFRSPVRASVGKGRILSTDNSTEAEFTRSVRAQMAAVMKNYEAWVNHMGIESAAVLKEALQPTFDKSQVIVPKDTGALARSGYLETRKFRGRVVAEIGYSRHGNPSYGPLVHENLDFYHESPTSAKFLERPLLEDSDAIQARIIRGYKEASGV